LPALAQELAGRLAAAGGAVLLHLRALWHHGRRLRQGTALEGPAEEERGGEPVAGDVVAQVDDVARLLAAQETALATQRLEHVAVADVDRQDANALVGHAPLEAEVRHRRDG